MAELTTSRIVMHSGMFIFLIGYVIHLQLSLLQSLFIFGVFIFYELMYLSYIIINNMKTKTHKYKVSGKRIVITGGSSGIGLELAKLFVQEGCEKMVIVARNEERLKTSVAELKRLSENPAQAISHLAVDLSSDGEKVAMIMKTVGTVDILVNCAGFSLPGEFQNLKVDVFENMMRSNYLSSVHATHALIPGMIKQRKGQVVFLSSVAGQLGVYGFTAYSASKYAVRGFAEVLYHEMRPYNVGVSLAFPPDTNTPGYENENKTKPKLCQMISEQAGLWEPTNVAKVLKDGILDRKFMIGFGIDGYFVNALTGGAAPSHSLVDFWVQTLLAPIFRVYMLFLQNSWTDMIDSEINTSGSN